MKFNQSLRGFHSLPHQKTVREAYYITTTRCFHRTSAPRMSTMPTLLSQINPVLQKVPVATRRTAWDAFSGKGDQVDGTVLSADASMAMIVPLPPLREGKFIRAFIALCLFSMRTLRRPSLPTYSNNCASYGRVTG